VERRQGNPLELGRRRRQIRGTLVRPDRPRIAKRHSPLCTRRATLVWGKHVVRRRSTSPTRVAVRARAAATVIPLGLMGRLLAPTSFLYRYAKRPLEPAQSTRSGIDSGLVFYDLRCPRMDPADLVGAAPSTGV